MLKVLWFNNFVINSYNQGQAIGLITLHNMHQQQPGQQTIP